MMNKKPTRNFTLLALLFILGLIIPTTRAKADMGIAPPSMHFSMDYLIPETAVVEGNLLVCEDVECETYHIFETVDHYSYGLPNFYCGGYNKTEWCYAGIGDSHFRKYHRISLVFDDGVTRISNGFKKWGYSSYYKVIVGERDLRVEEDYTSNLLPLNLFSPLQTLCFIPSAILTIVIETQAAKVYSKRLEKPIRHVLAANLISLPIVWFIIPYWLEIDFIWLFIFVEIFAIMFEAVFLFLVNRTSGFTSKNGFVTSILTNLASIGAGFFLIVILWVAAMVAIKVIN